MACLEWQARTAQESGDTIDDENDKLDEAASAEGDSVYGEGGDEFEEEEVDDAADPTMPRAESTAGDEVAFLEFAAKFADLEEEDLA